MDDLKEVPEDGVLARSGGRSSLSGPTSGRSVEDQCLVLLIGGGGRGQVVVHMGEQQRSVTVRGQS